jgi:RNA polymerase sigma-70 factor (ECF subfamily)
VTEIGDPLLVRRAVDGDVDAFAMLVRRYELRIFRLCLGMLANDHDAEEAAQDTFFTAWRAIGRFQGNAMFSTWLYRIAVNRCLKHLGRRPQPPAELPDQAGTIGNPEAEYEATQARARLSLAVAQLTPEQRAPLLLREVEGLTYVEIADVLGVTMTAVKSRLNRARVLLARAMDEHDR